LKTNSFDQSLSAVIAHSQAIGSESVSYRQAVGRVLEEDIAATVDDPPAPKSRMDGFALRSQDTRGASRNKPISLKYSEVVGAGHTARSRVTKGRAVRVMTGALMPKGADAVVKQEDTETAGDSALDSTLDSASDTVFTLRQSLAEGENVLAAGARMQKGATLLHAGAVVGPAEVGLLAGLGLVRVAVRRQPRVALLALGDELVEPGLPLGPGQLYVSNLHAIEAKVARYGGRPRNLGIAGDDPDLIVRLLRPRLLTEGDGADNPLASEMIITLGGSHGGDFDYAHRVLEALGATVQFSRTRLSLGGSVLFATLGGTLLFGLPGTPVPSLGAFELLVRPALWKIAGRTQLNHPKVQARLKAPVTALEGRRNFVPAWLEFFPADPPTVTPLRNHGRAKLPRDATLANGLIEVPDGIQRIGAGEMVSVMWLGE
jgi:molybdopterin molybdotransferase